MKKFNHEYVEHGRRLGGEQYLYKFENGYGASVIRNHISYGGDEGSWELAVITWNEVGTWNLCYSTEITNDVLGYLEEEDVEEILDRIKNL